MDSSPAKALLRVERLADALWLIGCNPPVNALSQPVRQGLVEGVAAADADEQVQAMVIAAEGRTFFAGADIDELDQGVRHPGLLDLVQACDRSAKPVVAALHGTVFGGGVVVAYAADHRIAAEGTRFAMPEVSLGLLPTFGGTQFLPRWLGVDAALRLVLDGQTWTSEQALQAGLIDAIVPASELHGAAARLAASRPMKRRVRGATRHLQEDPQAIAAAFARRRDVCPPGFEAGRVCLQVMETGLALPLPEALAREHCSFLELLASPQSRRLRRLFFAERRLRRCGLDLEALAALIRAAGPAREALLALARQWLEDRSLPDAALIDALIVQTLALPRHAPSLIDELLVDTP